MLGEKTLIPAGIALVAIAAGIGFGYNYRDHEAVKDEAVTAQITSLRASVDIARAEIMAKLDAIAAIQVAMSGRIDADHLAMLTKDEFDNLWRITRAIHPELSLPERSK